MEDKDKDSGEKGLMDKEDDVEKKEQQVGNQNGEQQVNEENEGIPPADKEKKTEEANKEKEGEPPADKEKNKEDANKSNEERPTNEKQQAKTDEEALVEKALKAYCCYLYVGKGHPYYKAQPWNDDDSYSMEERMRNLEILASNKKTELVPINKIKLAMDTKLVRRREHLMFALAMCARQKKSEKLRAAAYYFLTEHCKEWKNFSLFIKYASMLCKMEGSSDKDGNGGHIGWGRGWKNAVNKWYLDKTAWELVELVTRHKGNYGWTHKDILKLSHIDTKGLQVEHRAVFCYVIRGMEEATNKYRDSPEALHLLKIIGETDHFRKCKDPKEIIQLFTLRYTVDHVHPDLLKNKKVWEELLMRMDIRTMLKYLTKICDLGFLTKSSDTTARVVRVLTSKNDIEWNKILPGDILAVLNRYELGPIIDRRYRIRMDLQNRANCMEHAEKRHQRAVLEKAIATHNFPFDGLLCAKLLSTIRKDTKSKNSKEEKKKRRKRPTEEPDMRVRDALRTALELSLSTDITGASQRSYLIGVRLPTRRRNSLCPEVGLALALPLMRRAFISDGNNSVTLLGYEPRTMSCTEVQLTFAMSFDDALRAIYDTKEKEADYFNEPIGPVEWAIFKKKKYDVVINISNEPPTKHSLMGMRHYKAQEGLSHARFINIVNNRSPFQLKGDIRHEALTINGNDPHVPWIIEAYCRGLF